MGIKSPKFLTVGSFLLMYDSRGLLDYVRSPSSVALCGLGLVNEMLNNLVMRFYLEDH